MLTPPAEWIAPPSPWATFSVNVESVIETGFGDVLKIAPPSLAATLPSKRVLFRWRVPDERKRMAPPSSGEEPPSPRPLIVRSPDDDSKIDVKRLATRNDPGPSPLMVTEPLLTIGPRMGSRLIAPTTQGAKLMVSASEVSLAATTARRNDMPGPRKSSVGVLTTKVAKSRRGSSGSQDNRDDMGLWRCLPLADGLRLRPDFALGEPGTDGHVRLLRQ